VSQAFENIEEANFFSPEILSDPLPCYSQVPTVESRELLMYDLTHNKAPDRAPPGHSLFTLYTADEVFEEMAAKSDEVLILWARQQMEAFYPEVQGHILFGHAGL
jgi:hypothetical protein